jgi:catechol 2,3-dioxygenase-like lactoylglutathione lyase family enzyme
MSVDDPAEVSRRQILAGVGSAITVVSATIDDAMAQAALRSTSPASGGSVLIRAIHHFALVVNELDASIAWYSDILGFGLERRFGFPEVGVDIAHIVHPTGIRIELIQQTGSTRSLDVGLDAFGALKTQGAKHIGLLVEDIEGVAATLKAKGVEIVHDVTAVAPAGVRNFWIRDNSGNLIEFNQWL